MLLQIRTAPVRNAPVKKNASRPILIRQPIQQLLGRRISRYRIAGHLQTSFDRNPERRIVVNNMNSTWHVLSPLTVLLMPCERHRKPEYRSTFRLIFPPDPPPVSLYNGAGDGKTDPHALGLRRKERIKHIGQFFRRYPRPRIGNRDDGG